MEIITFVNFSFPWNSFSENPKSIFEQFGKLIRTASQGIGAGDSALLECNNINNFIATMESLFFENL